MKKRTAFIGAILSLIPLGQPLIIKTGLFLSTTGLMLAVSENVYARDSAFFYNRGSDKAEKGDHDGAISDYTRAIEIDPQNDDAFFNRGNSKVELKDYYGAISDYTRAIEIRPADDAYFNRGKAKSDLKDYKGSILDFSKAIEINPQYANAFKNRSISKENIGDIKGACEDAKKSVSFGDTASDNENWIKDNC